MKRQIAARLNSRVLPPVRTFLILTVVLTSSRLDAAALQFDAVNAAQPSGNSLAADRPTAIGIRLEVLLDRAHFSPGEIDGKFGENAKKALRAAAGGNAPSAETCMRNKGRSTDRSGALFFSFSPLGGGVSAAHPAS